MSQVAGTTAVPNTMQAIVQEYTGGPEELHLAEVPIPTLHPHDVLIRVEYAAINPVDMKVRRGDGTRRPVANPPLILGWDAVGTVVAVGAEASRFKLGAEVFCAGDITRAGSYAQYVAVDERIVGHAPRTLSGAEAAAVPLVALTAWEGLVEQMDAHQGDAGLGSKLCLVVGGGGGVGSIAIQIARQVCGLTVIATASRPESAAYCSELGAHAVVDHRQPLKPQFEALGYPGADYIFSTADLDGFGNWISVLNPLGKVCCITSGPHAQQLDVSPLFGIRGTLTFELMFTRPRTGIGLEKQGAILDRVAALLDQGTLRSTLRQEFDWKDIQAAHRQIETGHTLGKIAIRVAR